MLRMRACLRGAARRLRCQPSLRDRRRAHHHEAALCRQQIAPRRRHIRLLNRVIKPWERCPHRAAQHEMQIVEPERREVAEQIGLVHRGDRMAGHDRMTVDPVDRPVRCAGE